MLPSDLLPASGEHTISTSDVLALTRSLTLNQPLEHQLRQIVEVIKVYLGYNTVILSIYEPAPRVIRTSAAVGVPPEALERMRTHPMPEELFHAICSSEFQVSSSFFIPAGADENPDEPSPWAYYPPFETVDDKDGWHRGDDLIVPIRLVNGELFGFISVDNPLDGLRPSLPKIQTLEIFANQVATAIQNSRLYERARQQAERLLVLNEIGQVLTSTLELSSLYRTIIAQVERVLTVDSAYILLYNPDTQLCDTVFVIDEGYVGQGHSNWAPNDGPSGHVIRTGKPYVVNSPGDRIQHSGDMIGDKTRASLSALHVPMKVGDHVRGVISVQSYSAGAYDDDDLQIFSTIASQAAVAIYNAQLVETLHSTIASLQLTQDQLVQQEKLAALGQLAAGVAHELNNPLAGVMGFAELLLAEPLPRALRKDIVRIHHAASRCTRIVRNLLLFARPSVDERQTLDLNQVITLVVELHSYHLRLDSITLVTRLDPALPPLLADPYQLQQVLVNLITNAQHALRAVEGERTLTIATGYCDGWVSLAVEDTGPGIASEVVPRIFDPFFSTKEVGQGTGLGLSTAYSIVEAHQGRIEVETMVGKGTRFVVLLPAGEEQAERVAPPVLEAPSRIPEPQESSCRILIVDDEPIVARLIERILRRNGYETDVANDGRGALDYLRRGWYDGIVMDLKMPGLDGPSLYARLLEEQPEVARRILFTTGDSISDDSRGFLEQAGQPYLAKPFSMDLLLRGVQQLVETRGQGLGEGLGF